VNHQIGIVAHTKRAEQAHELMETVGAAYMSIDDGTLGCELHHRKVWMWHVDNTHTEWAINLEDDAVPVENFREQVQQALAVSPAPIVSLYLGKHHIPTLDWEQRKQQAIANIGDAHWLITNQLLHAVAVAIRTDILPDIISHAAQLGDFFPNDEAISHWAANNSRVAYTWPSLVNHADQPTLFVHHDKLPRPPGRIAYHTGTRPHWTDKAVTM
jgi:GR25 family glycosyltransferase involved in LPS biosynthesis